MNTEQSLRVIQNIIDQTAGDSDLFAETLRHEQVPHISFSQISAVEACPQRYYLQYMRMVEPEPVPDYFIKGKLFHKLVAAYYQNRTEPEDGVDQKAFEKIEQEYHGENQRHLRNAFLVHLKHCWKDCEIIGVEKPFVMIIDPDLPPCVGVIDLIARKDGSMILVDHKTGRDFYSDDELQMAIYLEHVHQAYGQDRCEFYYDHYRWVNDLNRIRKPAFHRTSVAVPAAFWPAALERIRRGWEQIDRIKTTSMAAKNGECFRCPYRRTCFPTR